MPSRSRSSRIADAWDALAESWRHLQGETGDANQRWIINPALFALLGEVRGADVLDAACGAGHLAREIARRGARVTAVDISPRMTGIAQRREQAAPLGVRCQVGDITFMPEIADASFDVVVSNMALMNVAHVEKAFGEFARVSRRRGRVVFSIPHPCYPRLKGGRGVFRKAADGEEWLEDYRVLNYQSEGEYDVPLAPREPDAKEVKVPTFHRTLGTYVSLLVQSGFLIDALVEPKPLDLAEAKSELGPGWWDATSRIPYYVLIRARRAD